MNTNGKSVTSKIIQDLIGKWIVGWILSGIIYNMIFEALGESIESIIIKLVIAVVLQGIMSIVIWKIITKSTLKGRNISHDDVSTIMKSLIIFTVIICIINGIYRFVQVNSSIEQIESTISIFSGNTESEEIKQMKSDLYIYLAGLEIGLTAIYLGVLPLEKRELLKYVE